MDSKSIGLCPQGFESPRCRFASGWLHVIVIMANGWTRSYPPIHRRDAYLLGPCAVAECRSRARGVVVSHPLSMREALGSIPSVSIFHIYVACRVCVCVCVKLVGASSALCAR
jgi:hypothetical protein